MRGGPSCPARSLLPLADPRFAGGRTPDLSSALEHAFRGNCGCCETLHADLGEQSLDLALLDLAGAEMLGRLGPARHREAQAVLVVAPRVAGGHEAGEEGVARPHRRDRLQRLERGPVEPPVAALAEQRQAPVGQGHDALASAGLDHLLERAAAVVLVRELPADQPLGLDLVGGHHVRALTGGHQQRLALGVEHGRHAQSAHLLDQAPVETLVHAPRQAAGEHADRRALGEVEELVHEQVELRLGHVRPVLVDLGLIAVRRVDHRRRGARLLAYTHEVVEDALLGQVLDDARPRGTAGDAGRDHRLAQGPQRARHVHALAARHRRLLDSAMTPPEPEVGDSQGLVDGGVEGDGDDHLLTGLNRTRRRRARRDTPTRIARTASTVKGTPRTETSTRSVPALGTSAAVTRPIRRTRSPSTLTVTDPTRAPAASGPETSSGASKARRTRWSSRRVRTSPLWGTSAARPSRYSMSERANGRFASSTRTRWKRLRPQRSSFRVSTSRPASLGSPITTEITRPPLRPRADPTSTYPACEVWPVFTPFTKGYSPISRLRFCTVRGRAPDSSCATGRSTTRAKRRRRIRSNVSAARSRAVE